MSRNIKDNNDVGSTNPPTTAAAGLSVESYHNPANPYSYGSRKTVQSFFPTVSSKNIDDTLQQSDIYTKFRQYRRPRQYLPIYVHEKRELFQMDIIYMDGRKSDNDGFKYILSVIDCYTKFAWCFPMQRILASTVVKHLRKLFSNPDNIPRKVHTDRGVGKLFFLIFFTPAQTSTHMFASVFPLARTRLQARPCKSCVRCFPLNGVLLYGYPYKSTILWRHC